VILLDTSAVLTLLWGEPGEEEVATLLREGDCAIPAACLSEVVDRLVRCGGNPPSTLAEKLVPLFDEVVVVPPIGPAAALRAGELRADHYERRNAALSHIDCLLLATAGEDDKVATSDGPLAKVARSLGITVVALPDSKGRRPSLGE
jgi:predicted nucleic acid-binding protein